MGTAFLIPFAYGVPLFAGAVAATWARRRRPAWTEAYATSIGAGGMAGESLMGLVVAALITAGVW